MSELEFKFWEDDPRVILVKGISLNPDFLPVADLRCLPNKVEATYGVLAHSGSSIGGLYKEHKGEFAYDHSMKVYTFNSQDLTIRFNEPSRVPLALVRRRLIIPMDKISIESASLEAISDYYIESSFPGTDCLELAKILGRAGREYRGLIKL